jgi:ABC-2 type transport system permease protein
VARRDWSVQRSYRLDLFLHLEGVIVRVATTLFLARLVPHDRLPPHSGGYFEFALVGLVAVFLTGVGLHTFTANIDGAQREGTLELLLASPTRVGTLLLGGLIVPLAISTVEVIGCFVLASLFGAQLDWSGTLLAVPIFLLLVASLAGMGIMSAAAILVTKRGALSATLITQASALFGGAIFPVSLLPWWGRAVAHLLPPYYALNGLRAAYLGGASVQDVLPNVAALAIFTVVLIPVGFWCFSRALHVVRVTGTLGTY